MRKAQKKQAEEIVRLLARIHEGIKKTIEAGQYESAMGLLAQCQESAINLGEMIEETEGQGTAAVSFLEKYCEQVYQIFEMARQGQDISGHKAYKTLKKSLTQAENSIRDDIKTYVEAVFLPYKASMWDSMESVWKAADEDPDCQAYVIPIPYYDKNPDGSFREEHYEGDQYPVYVPVVHYNDYDFAARRPDLIVIHNPYDDCNYVTSVHPFFYSSNLKKFTDQLVYIPYFILGEPNPENEDTLKKIEHFCTVPGVINADKVFVQSENMRKVYIDVMTEYTKNTGKQRKYWEEKILGTGSPKVDKVMETRKEDLEIPEDWLEVIRREDGSLKKIVLYNTGVAALLRESDHMIEKMKNVFYIFRKNSDDIALLWRPHPLIKATISSMRPHLWEEYRELVEEYRAENWGIYDDSPDLDRALVLSDAYYGDGSSLVHLFRKIGKPVMIQSVECLENIPAQEPKGETDGY